MSLNSPQQAQKLRDVMMYPEFAHIFFAKNKKLKYVHDSKQKTQYPRRILPPFLILIGNCRWLKKLTNNGRVFLGTKLVPRRNAEIKMADFCCC